MPRRSSIAIPLPPFRSRSLSPFSSLMSYLYSAARVPSLHRPFCLRSSLSTIVPRSFSSIEFDDFSKENINKLGHGVYEPLDVNLLPSLHLIYAENPSDSGKTLVRYQLLDIVFSESFSTRKPVVINVIVDPYAGSDSERLQHKN